MYQVLIKFLLMIALVNLLMGISPLLLIFSKFRTTSQNFTTVLFDKTCCFICFLILFKSKMFSKIVAKIVGIEEHDNCCSGIKTWDHNVPTKKPFHHSGGIPVEFHWSHGKWLKITGTNRTSGIPLKFHCNSSSS